jgi:sugar phosphate isomerase/epimerase
MRKAAVNRICRHIDLSTKLPGHPNVTIGLVRGKGGGIDTDLKQQHQWIVDCLKICAQYAKNSGVTLNLEPFNRYESFHLNDVFSAVSMIQEIGCPANVGILYDTFHANIEERDMQETILTYGKNFSHIHFADSNRRLPGEGHIDYGLTMQALHGINYQGYISLECVNAPNAEHVMEYAGNFVSLAKN